MKFFLPCNYNVVRKDRGGGVLLAFKKILNITQLSSPDELCRDWLLPVCVYPQNNVIFINKSLDS